MQSEKSGNSYLKARDGRQDALDQQLSKGYPALIFLSLNIPGSRKNPPGVDGLYVWALDELSRAFPELRMLVKANDLLGPYAIMALDLDPVDVKKQCVALEVSHPSARLLDLDVYGGKDRQLDRTSLGLPLRSCLICQQPAVECIRLKRHYLNEVIIKTHELLAPFRA